MARTQKRRGSLSMWANGRHVKSAFTVRLQISAHKERLRTTTRYAYTLNAEIPNDLCVKVDKEGSVDLLSAKI